MMVYDDICIVDSVKFWWWYRNELITSYAYFGGVYAV